MEVNKALSCCCSDNSHSRCGKGVVAGAYIYVLLLCVVAERQLAKLSVIPRENANTEISAVGNDWRDSVFPSSSHFFLKSCFGASSPSPSIFTIIIRWSNSGGHSWYWHLAKVGDCVRVRRRQRQTLWPKTPMHKQAEKERSGIQRQREEKKKSVLHHAGKYTGRAISTHVSFHKFLSREGKLLGNCPWNLSAQLIITITCSTVKASPKIKTSTHSAKHHLSPAFHVLFQLCVYLRCTVALKKEPQRSVMPIFQFQDTDNTPYLVGATWKKGRPASCLKRSTPEPVTKTEPAWRRFAQMPNGRHAMFWAV